MTSCPSAASFGRLSFMLVLIMALLGGVSGLWWLSPTQPNKPRIVQPAPLTPRQKLTMHLATADQKAAQALDQRLQAVISLFQRGKKGASAFAEDAVSWSGKWALLK